MSLFTKKSSEKKASDAPRSVLSIAHLYDVIERPVVTEKSTAASEQHKLTFKISPTATKKDVKAAVEAIFKVKVKKVNTINTEGKVKRFRGRPGQRQDFRKAVVTLEPGQTVDVAAGAR